jgi:hypothetical protein
MVAKDLASRGQSHTTFGTLHEDGAHFALQRLDLLGKRRLADENLLCRTREVCLFGDGEQVTQLAQFDVHKLCLSSQ